MRMTLSTVLAAALFAGGCARSEPAIPGNALVSTAPPAGTAAPAAGGAAGAADTARAPEPASAAPTWREITIPAGTQLAATLDTPVGSDTSRVEEPVSAHLSRSIQIHGDAVLPEGTRLTGVVTDAAQSAKVKGRARVALRFDALTPSGGERYAIRTTSITRTAQGTKKKDAIKIGAPAAGGAIIGALLGGKKGALVGTAVGGGAGTAAVLSTRGEEVHLAKGTPLSLKLAAPLTVRVKG